MGKGHKQIQDRGRNSSIYVEKMFKIIASQENK